MTSPESCATVTLWTWTLPVAGSTDTVATPAAYVPSRRTSAMPRPVTTPCFGLAPGLGDGRASHPADLAAACRTAIARGSARCCRRKSSESRPALAAISSTNASWAT